MPPRRTQDETGGLSTSPSKSTGPPLPPRKPTLAPAFPPPPPVRPRSVSPRKSMPGLPGGERLPPPPPPPRPTNLPPVTSKPTVINRGSTGYTSTSAGISAGSTPFSVVPSPFQGQQGGGGQHQTSELMKQSLQASKLAQSLKRHEAEKEKERVMQVLKSSSHPHTHGKSGTTSVSSTSFVPSPRFFYIGDADGS